MWEYHVCPHVTSLSVIHSVIQVEVPPSKGAFTVITITLIYRNHPSVCVYVKPWSGCCGTLHSSVLSVSPCPDIPVQADGCPVATGYFLRWSSPFTLSNCFKHSAPQWSGAAAFNQTPKNSSRGGWAGCRPQQGPLKSCAPICPPITLTEGQEKSQDPERRHVPVGSDLSGCFIVQAFFFLHLLVTCPHCSWRGKPDWVWASSIRETGQFWTMKLSVALFFAGLFGALAAVFILLSFGTDYWLLASESCHPNPGGSVQLGADTIEVGVQAAGRSESALPSVLYQMVGSYVHIFNSASHLEK